MTAVAAQPAAAVTPGTISNGDAGLEQRLDLLAAAAEDQRVAALEPDHALTELAAPHQERVDLGLAHEVAGPLLADIDQLGRRVGQAEDAGADQPVVDHDLGLAQQARGLEGQQLGVAGAGADQIHHAACGSMAGA